MNVCLKNIFLFALLLVGLVFADGYRILEDSKVRFALHDVVYDDASYPCENGGFRFMPENAFATGLTQDVFRVYRVALPSNVKPSVSISKVQTVPLKGALCKDDTLKFLPLEVKGPFLKDNLWMVDIQVPLFMRSGSSMVMRKSFDLRVDFGAGAATGINPGDRALSRVLNSKAGARFGVRSNKGKALRRAAADEVSSVVFLSKFLVGDKNLSSMSEDGLYAVPFRTIRTALLSYSRQSEIDGIKIENLRVYSASQDTLSAVGPDSKQVLPSQIFQVPIEVRDHSGNNPLPNGIFDDGDTLLFVGYGTSFWKRADTEDSSFVNGKMDYFHSSSPYDFYQGFLFGYSSSGSGKWLTEYLPSPSGNGKDIKWLRYTHGEKDLLLRDTYFGKSGGWESFTGKEWFWIWNHRDSTYEVSPAELNQPATVNLPGLVAGGTHYGAVTFFPHRSIWANNVEHSSVFDQEGDRTFSSLPYAERLKEIKFSFNVNGVEYKNSTLMPGNTFRVDSISLKPSGNNYAVTILPNKIQYNRFDAYSIAYQWNPVVDSAEWILPGAASGLIRVPVGSDDVRLLKFRNMEPEGLLKVSKGFALDSLSADDDVRYLAYKPNVYRTAFLVQGIPAMLDNELHDLSRISSKTQYLIIAPSEFMEPALSLGEFRSDGSAISTFATTVVSVDRIYQMYTGGRLSPSAIRNYISYAYRTCDNLKYVLLAGSGHYDYRGFNPKYSKNYIPPFELEDATTDDFFAVLDSGEYVRYGNYDIDMSVGRLPVSSVLEFATYIEKAKDYEKIGSYDHSDWRSNLLFAADDALNGVEPDPTKHTSLQEDVVKLVDSLAINSGFRWNMKKIYLLDYDRDAMGQKKDAVEDFLNVMNQGALYTTYFGHGSMTDWASEGLLKPNYVDKLSNKGRYTILNSFSCTVGRFDMGKGRSLSETFVLADGVGSIASLGAVRETFATYNENFGKNFLKYALFEKNSTIGDAFRNAKGPFAWELSSQRYNNEHYALIGEPVIRMPMDDYKIKFDNMVDTLKALDKLKLSGTVDGLDNGKINITLKNSRFSKRMYIGLDVQNDTIDVDYEGSPIYSGEIPVLNGRFEMEFITPRKMSFGDSAAEVRAWAYSNDEKAIGRYLKPNLLIYGFSSYADSINDNTPPSIKIKSCYSSNELTAFADDDYVKLESPACLHVEIDDSTSIDYREQADEGISFEVVGVENPTHPWPYMEQTAKHAVARKVFTTEGYAPGKYIFKVRALDVLGNVATKTLNFEITDKIKTGLADVFNVPNPVGKKGTTFYFKNLAVGRNSRVTIFIYNQNGRLVKVFKDAVSGETHWDGKDNHGRLLANGLYHYVVRNEVGPTDGQSGKTFTKKQKLLISR